MFIYIEENLLKWTNSKYSESPWKYSWYYYQNITMITITFTNINVCAIKYVAIDN